MPNLSIERLRSAPAHLLVLAAVIATVGCGEHELTNHILSSRASTQVGALDQVASQRWTVKVKNDNDDSDLPDHWRGWWWAKLDEVQPGCPTTLSPGMYNICTDTSSPYRKTLGQV